MRAFVRALSVFGIGVLAAPSCSLTDDVLGMAEHLEKVSVFAAAPADVALRRTSDVALSAVARPAAEPARETIDPPTTAPQREPPQTTQSPEPDVAAASAEVPEAPEVLVATSKETLVYARPSASSPKLGYLRAGAVVRRGDTVVGRNGCKAGFYEVSPEGYVCVGAGASLDGAHELARAATRRANRDDVLPYEYGIAKSAGVPLYSRIPSADEERAAEPGFELSRADAHSWDGVPLDDVPWFLAGGASSVSTHGSRFSRREAVLGTAIARTGFAFVSLFTSGGRRFGVTTDMAVVPLDRFTRVAPSAFHGVPLTDGVTLPVVFVRSKSAALYTGDPKSQGLTFSRRVEFREALPISGKSRRAGNETYLETTNGEWLTDTNLVRIDPLVTPPPWATDDRTWIDVSINRQTLVAYEGARPVFATLVSTGADGTGDPETTHSTIQGTFRIFTKHVSVTMDGDDVGDEFDLRDVPYVQYFKDGFAFHAAYWHDAFGTPHSHGCVNLSPLDARWLFAWTSPSVPTAWHGAMSAQGTLVSIHP